MAARIPSSLFSFCFAVVATLQAGGASGELTYPTEATCQNGLVTLVIKNVSVTINSETFTTRLYHYNGVAMLPGPTIKMKAGTSCIIEVRNELANTSVSALCPRHENANYHCPDTTVLHTHGLHVGPTEDNIDTTVNAQESLNYSYSLLANHLMGTHWYHAHKHGSTNLQVHGGLVGALIVEPDDGFSLPADLGALYGSSSREKLLMLNHIWLGSGDAGNGLFSIDSHTETSDEYGSDQTVSHAYSGSGFNAYVVNGQYQPTLTQYVNDTTVWRVIHGAGMKTVEIEISGGVCTMQVLARDGVFFHTSYLTTTSIALAQGNRADVAVRCTAEGSYTVSLTPNSINDGCLVSGSSQRMSQATLFTLTVAALPGGVTANALPTSFATYPNYLTDLRSLANNQVDRPVSGSDGSNINTIRFNGGSDETGAHGVNNIAFKGFDADESIRYQAGVMRVNRTVRVTLGGNANGALHPYHQHINHFQMQADDACNGQMYRSGEWRDVAPAQGTEIRWVNDRYSGEVVMHCHILQHEDKGMMALYRICNETETTGVCQYLPTPSPTVAPPPTNSPIAVTTSVPTASTSAPTITTTLAPATPTSAPTMTTSSPTATGELTYPTEATCQNGLVTLVIKNVSVTINSETFTTRLYHYNGVAMLPGPTIKMKAGTSCIIEVRNELANTSVSALCPRHENANYHCPDTTVLHTHGLHVGPTEDNIDTTVNAQESLNYSYSLLANHLMGTHWYHAHKHGSTNLQVHGGLVGALIVEPDDGFSLPADLGALYGSSSREKLLMLNHIWLGSGDAGNGLFSIDSHTETSDEYGSDQTVSHAYSGSGFNAYVVNGQYQPTLTQYVNDTTVWRVIHGAGMKTVEIEISGGVCTMQVLARDGVFFHTSYLTTTSIALAQGNRADVAVRCTAEGSYTVSLTPNSINDGCLVSGSSQRMSQATLFTLTVAALPGGVTANALPTSFATYPNYLTDLRSLANNQVDRPVSGSDGSNINTIRFNGGSDETGAHGVNNIAFKGFDADESIRYQAGVMRVNRTVRVTLGGNANGALHPYHQHINHFQMQADDACNGQMYRSGEWRDVAPAQGTEIRWVNDRYSGEVVMHCHILQHEDKGMMALYRICNETETTGVCQYLPTPSPTVAPPPTNSPIAVTTSVPTTTANPTTTTSHPVTASPGTVSPSTETPTVTTGSPATVSPATANPIVPTAGPSVQATAATGTLTFASAACDTTTLAALESSVKAAIDTYTGKSSSVTTACGSAVASFSVTMDSAGAANTFDSALESNPASVLGSTVVNTYGTPTVAITTWITSSPSASSESSSDDATEQNAAIGGAVAGAAVVAALVGLYFYHRKQKNRDERKSFAMHSKQAGARGEIGTVVASPPTAGSGDVAIKLARPPTLPLGWTEHVDEKTGAVYYFNDTTGESRWDRPQ